MSYGAYPGPWKEAHRQGFRPREGGANSGGFEVVREGEAAAGTQGDLGGGLHAGGRGWGMGASGRSPVLLRGTPVLPRPAELVCNRTFDKYACWPDTPANTTANTSCPWYLPWHPKGDHRGALGGGGGGRG